MNKDDAFRPFRNIEARVKEVADSLGCTVERFVIELDGTVHMIWGVLPDAILSDYEKDQRRIDAEFEAMARGVEEEAIIEQKMTTLKQDVASFMDGDDDD